MSQKDFSDHLAEIGTFLQKHNYQFRTITQNSHSRMLQRYNNTVDFGQNQIDILRDVFGWDLHFEQSELEKKIPQEVSDSMKAGKFFKQFRDTPSTSPSGSPAEHHEHHAATSASSSLRSAIRFSTHDEMIFAHTSFPTAESDAIFFGPDTYRYFNYIKKAVLMYALSNFQSSALRIVDIGAGSGAGGLFLANTLIKQNRTLQEVVLTDINKAASSYCNANTKLNFKASLSSPSSSSQSSTSTSSIKAFSFVESDVMKSVDGKFDVIISNPPYMVDSESSESKSSFSDGDSRLYRDGGGKLGTDLAARIVAEGLQRLNDGGSIILYTGAPIIKGGADPFHDSIKKLVHKFNEGSSKKANIVEYEEIDPDVWGEELDTKAYSNVERIAVIGLTIVKSK